MTLEQFKSYFGREPDENETALLKWLNKGVINGGENVPVFSAWGKVAPSLLNTNIPQEALDQVYGEGVIDELTLADFSLSEEVIVPDGDLPFALFQLSANYNVLPKPKSRKRYTTAEDGAQWLELTKPFGVTIDNLLTDEEAQALREGAE
jgi:hypothetical protein